MYCRQRSTLRTLNSGPKNGEHLNHSKLSAFITEVYQQALLVEVKSGAKADRDLSGFATGLWAIAEQIEGVV